MLVIAVVLCAVVIVPVLVVVPVVLCAVVVVTILVIVTIVLIILAVVIHRFHSLHKKSYQLFAENNILIHPGGRKDVKVAKNS